MTRASDDGVREPSKTADGDQDYWRTRRAPVLADALRRALKRKPWVNAGVSRVMSTRRGSDAYLIDAVRDLQISTVLDVACGEGNATLAVRCRTFGADIDGAPLERAAQLGYERTFTYSPPNYALDLQDEVDAITAIALNAHVPFEAFRSIVASGITHLKKGGHVIVVAECDNDGLSYRLLRSVNRRGFDSLVQAMGHYFLEREATFIAKLMTAMPDFELVSRRAIVGSFVPYLQYRHALTLADATTRAEQALAFGFDVALGLVNRAQLAADEGVGKSFLVGFVLREREGAREPHR